VPLLIGGPGDCFVNIRSCLSKKRQKLIIKEVDPVYANDLTILESPQAANDVIGRPEDATVDANYGPEPGDFSAIQMQPDTWIVHFSITTWLYECCQNELNTGDTPNPITSNRWADSVSIDENFYTTYTRKGTMQFRADAFTARGADIWRNFITASCPLKTGFLRTKSDYALASDGLRIDYNIEDREQYAMPLPPATKFDGDYKITTNKGVIFFEEATVRAWSSKNQQKSALAQMAITVILQRLRGNSPTLKAAGKIIRDGTFKDKINENYVEMSIKVFNKKVAGNLWDNMSVPYIAIPNGQLTVPDPGERGTAGLILLASVINDPCLTASPVYQEIRNPSKNTPKDAPPINGTTIIPSPGNNNQPQAPPITSSITVVKQIMPNTASNYKAAEFIKGWWTDYTMDIDYTWDFHIAQMPQGSSSSTKSSIAVLGNPTMRKIVNWTAEKCDDLPTMPDPNSGDTNETLCHAKIIGTSADYEADHSTPCFRVRGIYEYAIGDTSLVKLFGGIIPYTTQTLGQSELIPSKFVKGLTSAAQAQAPPIIKGIAQAP